MKHPIRTLRNLFRNRRYKKVAFNFFKLLLLILFIVFSIFSAISYLIYSSARKIEVERDIERNFMRTANALNIIFQTVDRDSIAVNFDENIQAVITKNRQDIDHIPSTAIISNSVKRLTVMTMGNRLYDSIHIYCPKSDMIISWSEFTRAEDFDDTEWIRYYQKYGYQYSRYSISPRNNTPILSIYKNIALNNTITAYMVFNLEYSYLAGILTPEEQDGRIATMILSQDGTVVFSTDSTMLNRNIAEYDNLSWFFDKRQPQADGIVSLNDDNSLYMSYATANAEFLLVSVVNTKEYASAKGSLYNTLLTGSIIGLLLSIILAVLMTIKLYGYIFDIIVILQSPNGIDIGSMKKPPDEMNFIGNNILSKADSGKSIEADFARQLSELRKAQSMALQAQINPHFLLNTMQVIYFSIIKEVKQECKATRMITLLSSILRSNLQTKNYLVDLAGEITVAKNYLEIERIRNGDSFQVQWDIDKQVVDLYVVRFILQPILENCLMYGLKNNRKPEKIIQISAVEEIGQLVIHVEDNGLGMDEKALAELRNRLARQSIPEDQHIGLCNVNMRIKLIFGSDSGVTVNSIRGSGTAVTIRIPAIRVVG